MSELPRIHGIRAIVFDWNGTLKSMDEVLAQDMELGRRHGHTPDPEAIRRAWGGGPVMQVVFGTDTVDLDWARAEYDKLSPEFPKRLMPGVLSTIRTLRRTEPKLHLGIVTGGPRARLDLDMAQAGLPREYFDFTHSGAEIDADIAAGRPAFTKALGHLAALGLARSQMLVVGDEPNNVRDAQEAGIPHVLISSAGTMSRQTLIERGVLPAIIIPTVAVLPEILQ